MADVTWPELVDVARWAPSPHNMQPWKVRPLSPTEAELLVDPARLLPETDPDGAFMTVGLGIFTEMLAVGAHARGQELEAELVGHVDPRADARNVFGRLRLVPRSVDDPLSPQLVLERRTSRIRYDGRVVEDAVAVHLQAVVADFGHTLETSSDPLLVDWLLDLNRETLFHDLTDPVARREVGSWLRFSARAAARSRDGFSPAALGFPGWLLRAYFTGARAFELPAIRTVVRRLYGRQMQGTRTVGWITGPWGERDEWFAAGRMLARLWLTMTLHGVVLHPFGSVITNGRANARLRERISPRAGTLWLVFRAGYSAQAPRSHRLDTAEVLVE